MPWRVTGVEEKPITQRPAAPFTTSTLQQEANRKLGFSSDRTMNIAQRLFQGIDIGGGDLEGLISYHRTDSTTLSDKALGEAGQAVREMYGDDYYKGPRQYQTKVRNAQEAHEAIRPDRLPPHAAVARARARERRAEALRADLEARRRLADGRRPAAAHDGRDRRARRRDGQRATFSASGKAIEFAGYLRAYVEGSDDPSAELGEQETLLPKLAVGDQVHAPDRLDQAAVSRRRSPPRATTPSPPARYTEASLVKRLEEEGIGRPSTYAPTVATIQRRGYVTRQGKALVPSFTAFAVTRLLREHFADYVDIGFTAEMEEILDEISNGEKDWLDFITRVLPRRRQAHRPRDHRPGQGAGDRLPDDRPGRRSRDRASRCACASAATVRSCSSASRPTTRRARRSPTRSARPISRSTRRCRLLKAKAEGPQVARRRSDERACRST